MSTTATCPAPWSDVTMKRPFGLSAIPSGPGPTGTVLTSASFGSSYRLRVSDPRLAIQACVPHFASAIRCEPRWLVVMLRSTTSRFASMR